MQSLWEDSHAARGIIGCAAYAAEPGSEAFYVVRNDVLRTFRLCSDSVPVQREMEGERIPLV
jgi:hypothetical protein